jgi:hypothetical protein
MQRLQRAELLRDDQRRVVGQHHAARTHPDRAGRRREVGQQHGRRRTGDAGHVVVLGHPEPVVAELLGAPDESGGMCQSGTVAGALGDRCQVEDG